MDLRPQCNELGEDCVCPPGFLLETDICLPSAAEPEPDAPEESESGSGTSDATRVGLGLDRS